VFRNAHTRPVASLGMGRQGTGRRRLFRAAAHAPGPSGAARRPAAVGAASHCSAYRVPSMLPKYTVPRSTTGDDVAPIETSDRSRCTCLRNHRTTGVRPAFTCRRGERPMGLPATAV
jgi:hypothetical protein